MYYNLTIIISILIKFSHYDLQFDIVASQSYPMTTETSFDIFLTTNSAVDPPNFNVRLFLQHYG